METFDDRVARLHELAAKRPDQIRAWIERHPRNLMIYSGWEPQPFHDEGFEHFLTQRHTLWLAPRGSGKSTVAVFIAAWLAISRPDHRDAGMRDLFRGAPRRISPKNIRVALTSNSHPKAVALLWQVKKVLTDSPMAKLYGPLAGRRWRDEMADTRLRSSNLREPTFTALGLGSSVTGGHYDVVICDDWVTLDNSRTELQRSRTSDFWAFTVKATCEPWGRVGFYGTRYHPRDFYGTIAGEWGKRGTWKVLRHPAVIHLDNGDRISYWPQAYSLDTLDAIRDEIGSVAFATQYQNETELMLGEFFEDSWLQQHCVWAERPKEEREAAITGVALDPAFKGGPRNDWSVFSVLHVNRPKRFHFERIYRGRWTKDELVRQSKRIYLEHRPTVFAVEANAGSEWLIDDLRKAGFMPRSIVKAMPPRINKLGRADKVRTFFETGCVWFDPPTPANQLPIALDELLAFTGERGGIDDCVDSMVWNMIATTRGRSRLRRVPNLHGRAL